MSLSVRRRRRGDPRNRLLAFLVVLGAVVLVGLDVARGDASDSGMAGPDRSSRPDAPARPRSGAPVPATPTGSFDVAAGTTAVHGRAGKLLRYHVAVEQGTGIEPATFARRVDQVLADPRGWTAGGDVRFQRVGPGTAASFTVLLATPVTSERICRTGGMETGKYTNCRLSDGRVVLNLDRWLSAVPDYGAPLEVYQAYAVNHEVGHQLGHGHEGCPGPEEPAPVMQQQTLGLTGCVAYPWPYRDGVRYLGPPAA